MDFCRNVGLVRKISHTIQDTRGWARLYTIQGWMDNLGHKGILESNRVTSICVLTVIVRLCQCRHLVLAELPHQH